MDYYRQDAIQPTTICHGYDYGDPRGDGSFGYVYNFIDYHFEGDGLALFARHYLDEPDEVNLKIESLIQVESVFARKVLVFLAMRFGSILYPADNGYEALPAALMEDIGRQVREHMVGHSLV